jgi:elongation factor P--beta-lysine ligase
MSSTNATSRNAKLSLADILDIRAYERTREVTRREIIELKELRRVHVGTVISLVFENRATMLFQVHEMARAEKIFSDEALQAELDIYNPLIPESGQLSATLFIECTSDEQMKTWLPNLVGIQRSVEIHIGSGNDIVVIQCVPEAAHEAQLTREEITAAVHYIFFPVGVEHAEALRRGPAKVVVTHPSYLEETQLGGGTRAQLADDVAG